VTAFERQKAAQSNAFRYQEYRAAIADYKRKVMRTSSKAPETAGCSSGHTSDPTASMALKLADPPKYIKRRVRWVRAIEDAWAEAFSEDDGEEYGLAFAMERYFHLTGPTEGQEENTLVREEIMEKCGWSRSTFYQKLGTITEMLVYHAARKGLL
jgi:hypothetical protein